MKQSLATGRGKASKPAGKAAGSAASRWSLPTPPTSYGEVDDGKICRHLRIAPTATLQELKRAVLQGYEDQYTPAEITLFSCKYDDKPKPIRTDRQCATALSYQPDWADLRVGDPGGAGSVLLVVSAMSDLENELLVLPAAWSSTEETLLRDLTPPQGASAAAAAALPVVQSLANAQPSLFDPLPLPAIVDDWLAQVREAPQSLADLLASDRPVAAAGRNAICVQPLVGAGGRGETQLFDGLHAFLVAFFDGTPVRLLEPIELSIDKGRRRASVGGRPVAWRDECPVSGEAMPHGQLSAPQLLDALKPKVLRGGGSSGGGGGGGGGGTRVRGAVLPQDAFCVLGVTLIDLFCGDDDVFTGGLASLGSRTGVFSFHRYSSGAGGAGAAGGAGGAGLALARACKTAAHEIVHMYGIGHCVHRHCLMNGCGHLLEDFAAPAHLCPVDLAKLAAVLGSRCDLRRRYEALLAFCEAHPDGFAEHARWLRSALARIEAAPPARPAAVATQPPPSQPPAAAAVRGQGPRKRDAPEGRSAASAVQTSVDLLSSDDDAPLVKRIAARMAKGE